LNFSVNLFCIRKGPDKPERPEKPETCGIAGFVGDFIPGLVSRMNAIQKHRGPDGQFAK
jgi:hypothetical protein